MEGATDRYGYGVMWVSWLEKGKKLERGHRVALMVLVHLTRSQFPGGGLEVSQLSHKKLCVTGAPGCRSPCHQPGEATKKQPEVLLKGTSSLLPFIGIRVLGIVYKECYLSFCLGLGILLMIHFSYIEFLLSVFYLTISFS